MASKQSTLLAPCIDKSSARRAGSGTSFFMVRVFNLQRIRAANRRFEIKYKSVLRKIDQSVELISWN